MSMSVLDRLSLTENRNIQNIRNLLLRDPHNCAAWLKLADLLDDAGQKEECLLLAVKLNPGNVLIRARSEEGKSPADSSPTSPPPQIGDVDPEPVDTEILTPAPVIGSEPLLSPSTIYCTYCGQPNPDVFSFCCCCGRQFQKPPIISQTSQDLLVQRSQPTQVAPQGYAVLKGTLSDTVLPVTNQLLPEVTKERPAPPQPNPSRAKRRIDTSDIWMVVLNLGNTGTLVVPIIIVGELILEFLISYATKLGGNFLLNIVIGAGCVLLICFLIPLVGTLVTIVLRVLMVLGGIAGKVFGYGLGLVCALVYYLTLWAPIAVSYVLCMLAGGASGWAIAKIFSYIGDTRLLQNPGPWFYLHYLSLIGAGMVGAWYFVSIVAKAENGESLEGLTSENQSLQKSAQKLWNITNTTEKLTNEGERFYQK